MRHLPLLAAGALIVLAANAIALEAPAHFIVGVFRLTQAGGSSFGTHRCLAGPHDRRAGAFQLRHFARWRGCNGEAPGLAARNRAIGIGTIWRADQLTAPGAAVALTTESEGPVEAG